MAVATCLPGLNPAAYQPHALHDPQRNWPETNCYVDLWIEVLNAMGFQPEAALGFTVTQDFEGDQFTFFKFPPEDIAALFDLNVQELAIYDRVESHTLEQAQRGRLVLIEVDSFYLPDTRGVSYQLTHGKTTIAVNHIDSDARVLHYFHNAGFFALSDSDYDGIFRQNHQPGSASAALFPYVEFVKPGKQKPVITREQVVGLLKHHLRSRPVSNPLRAYQQAFPSHAEMLAQRPMEFFHLYAFNTLRQIGANFEMLGSHLSWLAAQGEKELDAGIQAANEIAAGAKTIQFQLARAVTRKKFDSFVAGLEPLAVAYDAVFASLARYCD
ncbi:MAG TPA: DUF1839 family protein [Steroidobacteraceae bacterium]|nr:DUF1839 family protein [Steroidobacteraceae bacterium]